MFYVCYGFSLGFILFSESFKYFRCRIPKEWILEALFEICIVQLGGPGMLGKENIQSVMNGKIDGIACFPWLFGKRRFAKN